MTTRSFNSLLATEKTLAIYLVLTMIFAIGEIQSLASPLLPILIRVLLLGVLFILAKPINSYKEVGIGRILWPLLTLAYLYGETDVLNNILFKENLDPLISSWEYAVFKSQPALLFSKVIASNGFAEIMYFGYFAYYLLIVGTPWYIYKKYGSEKAIFSVFIIMNSFFIYYLFFIVFPVAGPQFYFKDSLSDLPQGYFFGWLIRRIQQFGEAPTAAFPSSHVSICLMLVWLIYKIFRKQVIWVLPIVLTLLFSTVYIKAHYAIDVIAAFISTPVVYHISKLIFRKLTLANPKL